MTGHHPNPSQSGRQRISPKTLARCTMFGLIMVGLMACGGNGESNQETPPDAPTLSLTPEGIKTFSFDWNDVDSETEYRLLENPDGMSGYSQVVTIAANVTSYDLTAFLPGLVNASYILSACNGSGCSDSAPVYVEGSLDGTVGYIKASNTGEREEFGYSITLSGDGDTLAVGSFIEDSNATGIGGNQNDSSALNSGAVYIFTRSGSTWLQQAYLKASNAEAADRFGYSIALADDGNTLAVGADYESSNATGIGGDQTNNSAGKSGAVYVFTRNGTDWTQQAYIKASNADVEDYFGSKVTLSANGDTLAVSSSGEDSNATGIGGDQGDNSAENSGAVYVFARTDATWSQQAYFKASNTERLDRFGQSLALASDGNTLAAGSYLEDSNATGINGDETDNSANGSGAVYVFTRSGTTWAQRAYIKASNTNENDQFGHRLALSANGDTLAAGAWNEASNTTGIDGDQADNSASSSGAIYMFTRSDATWSQQAYIKASNTNADDFFGISLALSGDGNSLAVGAYGESGDAIGINDDESNNNAFRSGAVYTFTRNNSDWSQQAYIKAPNAEAEDWFGFTVALSGDGNTLAAGALAEDSSATGINGDQTDNAAIYSGAVYLY